MATERPRFAASPVDDDDHNGHRSGPRREHAVDERVVDEIVAMWRRGCAHHVSAPEACRYPAPEETVRGVLEAIGVNVADASADVAALDSTMFSCSEAHIAVAQLGALRRSITLVLALTGDTRSRLDELIESATTNVVKECIEELCRAALLDPLTGLRNRRAFIADATSGLATARRSHRPVAVALVDMVGLKHLNDEQSHAAGDDALRRLAKTLTGIVRAGDNVYRIGGDEFVALLPGAAIADASEIFKRVNGEGCSFRWGVASAPDDGYDVETLVDVADRRMIDGRRGANPSDDLRDGTFAGRQG